MTLPNPQPSPAEADTGLPGLRTWRGVYLVVSGIFLLWVVLLTALTWMFPRAG